MASYNSNLLSGAGAPIEALTSGSTYTFTITSPISSSLNISIGQNFQGGKLAYILTSSDAGYDPSLIKGIIAADADEADAVALVPDEVAEVAALVALTAAEAAEIEAEVAEPRIAST